MKKCTIRFLCLLLLHLLLRPAQGQTVCDAFTRGQLVDSWIGGSCSTINVINEPSATSQAGSCTVQGFHCNYNRVNIVGPAVVDNQIVVTSAPLTLHGNAALQSPLCGLPGQQDYTQVKVTGSTATLHNLLFDSCFDRSVANTVVIQVSNTGNVIVNRSTFRNLAHRVTINPVATTDGAAIQLLDSSTCTIIDSLFDSNFAQSCGGSIYVGPATMAHITGSTFVRNTAGFLANYALNSKVTNAHALGGGAICVNGGLLTVVDSLFDSNNASN